MKKSLARPILHVTLRQPLTQANGYDERSVYRIEEHLKRTSGTGLNGHSFALSGLESEPIDYQSAQLMASDFGKV